MMKIKFSVQPSGRMWQAAIPECASMALGGSKLEKAADQALSAARKALPAMLLGMTRA
jgi:hypothetical protein